MQVTANIPDQPILFLPHTICKWFSCDYSDVYAPILENFPGKYKMIDKYLNGRTINIINDMNNRFDEVFVSSVNVKSGIKLTNVNDLKELLRNSLNLDFYKTIVMTHGHTFDSYHNEGKMWLRYQSWKSFADKNIPVKLSAYEYDFAFIYTLAELCIEYDVTIKSIWFDPLQIKLNYIDGLKIENYSFHSMTDTWENLEVQKYIQDSYREVTVGIGEVDCRQSHAYISAYQKPLNELLTSTDLYELAKSKTLKCAFGMSLTWKAPFRERFVHTVIKMNNSIDNKDYYMCYKTSRPRYHSIPATSINPPLPYIDYVNKVSTAYTTIMLPSMDVNSFSVIRFIESICYGTIPLIYDNNVYEAGFSYDQSIIDVYKKWNLFLDSSASIDKMYTDIKLLANKVSVNYLAILSDILSTDFIAKLADKDTYKQEAKYMCPDLITVNELLETHE